jgi:GR25 family glycosyltransferase involved in LPS biosynthesis
MTSDVALVINLDKRQDRWKYMQKVAQKLGHSLERMSAVDGHAVPVNSLSLDPLVRATLHTRKKFSVVHIESAGALGCMMSHRNAWMRVQDFGVQTLILEDDAEPSEFASAWVAKAKQQVQEGTWDLVLLGLHEAPATQGRGIVRLASWMETGDRYTGSWAYVVSPQAAAKLLETSNVMAYQSDMHLHAAGLRVGFVQAFGQATFFQTPDIRHTPLEPISKRGFVYAFVVGFLLAAILAYLVTR